MSRVTGNNRTGAGQGKKNKFVLYNSTFRNGITFGHLVDIDRCMRNHVIPNKFRGIVIGIGLPDPTHFFPGKDAKRAVTDPIYAATYEDIKSRLQEPEKTRNYFTRLYELELALRGKFDSRPSLKENRPREIIDFEPVPYNKVFIVPKYPHVIYPERYDTVYKKDFQGQLEPPKDDIHTELISVGDRDNIEGRPSHRIKNKLTEERNIPVTIVRGDEISEELRRIKDRIIFTSGKQKEIMERLNSCEFVVTVMPYGSLGAEHKSLVDETINNAFKKTKECILAVPYLTVPKRKEKRVKFWIEQRKDPSYGRTFERYVDLKNYVFSLFERTQQELGKIHITFAEADRNGQFSSSRSLSYIKPNFVPILRDIRYGMYDIVDILVKLFEPDSYAGFWDMNHDKEKH